MTLTNTYRICSDDRQPQFFSHSYAISISLCFGILLNGGMLLPIDLEFLGIGKVSDRLAQNQVTMLHWIPSLVNQFISALTITDEQRFPKLRLLAFGGGAVAREDFISWQKHLPNTVLASVFGSTEANGIALNVI